MTTALEKARAERGLTQVELASAADVHPAVISRAENGRPPGRYVTRMKIARALDLEPGDLFEADRAVA